MNIRYVLTQSIKLTLAIVTLSLLIFAVWALWQPSKTAAPWRENRLIIHAEPVTLPGGVPYLNREGERRFFVDQWQSGDVWLVNFWASWCAPCLKEVPYLDGLLERYSGRGLKLMAVSQDFQPDGVPGMVRVIESFYRQQQVDWEVYLYAEYAKRDFHMEGLPTTLIIARQGRERARMIGAFRPELAGQVEALLEQLLRERPPTSTVPPS